MAGLLLVGAYFLQHALPGEWAWLARAQGSGSYRLWTGLVLLLYLGALWWLSVARIRGWRKAAKKGFDVHKQLGLVAPVLFFVHAPRVGYAYLFLLTLAFFANTVVGLANVQAVPMRSRWVRESWMVVHVFLAVLVTALVLYHVVIVFYYN